MKKTNFKKKFIEDPIFGGNFWFCLGNKDKFKKFVEKKTKAKIELSEDSNGARYEKNNIVFVWIEKKDFGVLIHELQHNCLRTLDGLGMKVSVESEEVYAYYIEYTFNKCLKAIKTF